MMQTGEVVVVIVAKARARTRGEWEQALGRIWPQMTEELRLNPGFKGSEAMWNLDDSGEVVVIGRWENMERRKSFESGNSAKLRSLMNQLFAEVPRRPKLVVTHVATER